MKKTIGLFGALLPLLTVACASGQGTDPGASGDPAEANTALVADDDEDGEEQESEQVVSLASVPAAAKQAALDAVPGLVLHEAEEERHRGEIAWCLHGTADGVFTEVEVTASGEVLEIEQGEEDD